VQSDAHAAPTAVRAGLRPRYAFFYAMGAALDETTLLFAYGTLMTGFGNNRVLAGAQSLGRALEDGARAQSGEPPQMKIEQRARQAPAAPRR
jgi:hypothetical protein